MNNRRRSRTNKEKSTPVTPSKGTRAVKIAPPNPQDGMSELELNGWLIRGQRGSKANAANVVTILKKHPLWKAVIAYDAFGERIVTLKPPPCDALDAPATITTGELSSVDTARLINWMSRHAKIDISPKIAAQALMVVAQANRFHPVLNYLRRIPWDLVPRLDTCLVRYFGADDTPYVRGVGARWMISAIARVMQPGCQVDCTLVLEGPQGHGKNRALRALVPEPEWYVDSTINIGDKDSLQNLHGVWIYGFDELDSLSRHEVSRIKTFLTQTTDRFRPPYADKPQSFRRQNIFVGTTNDTVYLNDKTGNRRFLPVRLVNKMDIEALKRDRDQLWAEAKARYSNGERWHVNTIAFRKLCEAEQAERVVADPWEEIVARWIANPIERQDGSDAAALADTTHHPRGIAEGGASKRCDLGRGILSVDVLRHAIGKAAHAIARADETRVGIVLRTLGYERGKQHRENGLQVRRYVKRGTTEPTSASAKHPHTVSPLSPPKTRIPKKPGVTRMRRRTKTVPIETPAGRGDGGDGRKRLDGRSREKPRARG
jgi:putative DNA primase/helicase